MATQLGLYNQALLHLKNSALASVSEANERRRVLDEFYTPVKAYMLEQGYWNFALRTVKITSDPATVPDFGPSLAFQKPDDWVKTYIVSPSEFLMPRLEGWLEESNLWFAQVDPIYVRYVSNSLAYGGDLLRFTSRYEQAVAFELAWRAAPKLAGAGLDIKRLEEDKNKSVSAALSFEAQREPPRRPPLGTWARSRFSTGRPTRYSGGYQF